VTCGFDRRDLRVHPLGGCLRRTPRNDGRSLLRRRRIPERARGALEAPVPPCDRRRHGPKPVRAVRPGGEPCPRL